jgi:hypothetical protein
VWSDSVVIVLPIGQHGAGLDERGEQGLVQAFVAQAFNEGFREGVAQRSRQRARPTDSFGALPDAEGFTDFLRSKFHSLRDRD